MTALTSALLVLAVSAPSPSPPPPASIQSVATSSDVVRTPVHASKAQTDVVASLAVTADGRHRRTLTVGLLLPAAFAMTISAQERTHVPRIDRLEVLQAKSDDMNLASVAGRAYVVCSNEGFGLSLGAPDKVIKKGPKTNTIWISNGQPGSRVTGSCELSVYVQDNAGNKSATVKVPIEFK